MYNENKVKRNVATFLDAGFYFQDPGKMTLQQKLARLSDRINLNERSKVNVVAFSLNFDKSDRLTIKTLKRISFTFLKEIGLNNHPYLVYEHLDTPHPHLHLISTLIRADGSRVADSELNIGRLREVISAIEAEFGLKKAHSLKPQLIQESSLISYGTKQNLDRLSEIKVILNKVIQNYKYSSFSEYNAVLRQFNVQASQGSENSWLFKFKGIIYRTIDPAGKQTCIAIKASKLDGRATFKSLALQFDQHRPEQIKNISRLKNTIDIAMLNAGANSLQELAILLEKQGVKIHINKEKQENDFTLIYIDNRTQCAFDSRSLGKDYGLTGLYYRCEQQGASIKQTKSSVNEEKDTIIDKGSISDGLLDAQNLFSFKSGQSKINVLLHNVLMPSANQSFMRVDFEKSLDNRKARGIQS